MMREQFLFYDKQMEKVEKGHMHMQIKQLHRVRYSE